MATIVTRNGKGSKLTIAEMDENFINLNTKKAELGIDNKVDPSQLTDVFFKGLTGDGKTHETAYSFLAGNPDSYLKALPGYTGTGSLMLYVNDGLFSWGPVPSGSVGSKLDTPVLTISNTAMDSVKLNWNTVFDAKNILIQRDQTSGFTSAVSVFNGLLSDLSFTDIGLVANTNYYYRARASAPGFQTSDFGATVNVTTLNGGNITPAKPVVVFNPASRTLTASHALGTSEILMSVNGNAFIAYASVSVDDNAYVGAYWRFKIKAATGRNESDTANSPEISANTGSGNLGIAITAANIQYASNTELVNVNTIRTIDKSPGAGGSSPLTFNIPLGESGFVLMQRTAFALTGETRSGILTLGIGIDPHYGAGDPKCLFAVYFEDDGKLWYRIKNAPSYAQTAAGVINVNGYVRIRATNASVYLEVSNNAGQSWASIANTTRISADATPTDGILRSKPTFVGGPEMQQLVNVRVYNGG